MTARQHGCIYPRSNSTPRARLRRLSAVNEEETADDPVVEAQRLLVTRFVRLEKVGPLAEFVREDSLKVGGNLLFVNGGFRRDQQ